MRYKDYGKTGISVSCVGFGGMRFDTSLSNEKNAELLHYAREKGVNYFDTAPMYCEDKSEDIFGIAFKDLPKGAYISTKGMPTEFDTAQKAKDQVRKSLDRLGVEKIDFYHVWCLRKMEHYELAMRPGGQYEGLMELKEEGLIGNIVCSSHMPGADVKHIVEEGKMDGVLLGANILNFPYRWDAVEAAHEHGMGVVAMNPLSGGAIPSHEKELAFLAGENETPTEAALRFVMACNEITVGLVGFTTREQIDMACRVADTAKAFTPEEIAALRAQIGDNMNTACTGCGYCKDCPQNIPVHSYMQYFNEKQIFGKDDEKMIEGLNFQYNWGLLVGRKAEAIQCSECGKCEEACTQHLPIIERLKEITEWERKYQRSQLISPNER